MSFSGGVWYDCSSKEMEVADSMCSAKQLDGAPNIHPITFLKMTSLTDIFLELLSNLSK